MFQAITTIAEPTQISISCTLQIALVWAHHDHATERAVSCVKDAKPLNKLIRTKAKVGKLKNNLHHLNKIDTWE